MRAYLIILTLLSSSLFFSQPALTEEAALPVEPEITIRREATETFYEYRVNGILKEIRVEPEVGPTYYLVPQDGNAWIREDRSQVLVPSWILFKW
tara:strand:+ start:391 stop:675 length:285 start_codon:yes stop_codon:yes gene_type:complete